MTWNESESIPPSGRHAESVTRGLGRARPESPRQIVKTMAKQYKDAIGPWREFLPVVDAP